MKILIVLDIDGTITNCHYSTPERVVDYFNVLQARDFVFAFVTGRTFARGYRSLSQLDFPYYFSVQNGALLLQMPERSVLKRKYLSHDAISMMDAICREEGSDYVVYSGFEGNDITYYRENFFSPDDLKFLLERSKALDEDWRPVDSFADLKAPIVSLKFFGSFDAARRISEKLEQRLEMHAPAIFDPYDSNYFIVQATDPEASKGMALQDIKELAGAVDYVIAAGDDRNDLSMLLEADVKIAMSTAPDELLEIADVIAPAASEDGIIQGLEKAIAIVKQKWENK